MSEDTRPTLRDTEPGDGLSPSEAEALGRRNHANLMLLRERFGDRYRVNVEWPDRWSAVRHDDGTEITAPNAGHLAEKMTAGDEARYA
jgi:hypothetical protein